MKKDIKVSKLDLVGINGYKYKRLVGAITVGFLSATFAGMLGAASVNEDAAANEDVTAASAFRSAGDKAEVEARQAAEAGSQKPLVGLPKAAKPVGYGKALKITNPTPIKINDTCANPDTAECSVLVDYYNPVLPVLPDGQRALPPEVPVAEAAPYASYINVPETAFKPGAVVSDVNVYINNIYHDYLNDVDIILVAPNGQWVMVASNVSAAGATPEGGVLGIKAEGLNWKFDDSATLPLPRSVRDDGRLSGRESNPLYNVIYDEWIGVWSDKNLRTFKPTDYDSYPDSDHFPNDVISSTFSTSRNSVGLTASTVLGDVTPGDITTYKKVLNGPELSHLNGIDPAGNWRLIVVDDFYWYAGEIKGGWSLEITTARK
jgi:subtilisin-like proprotein convertase family protein